MGTYLHEEREQEILGSVRDQRLEEDLDDYASKQALTLHADHT